MELCIPRSRRVNTDAESCAFQQDFLHLRTVQTKMSIGERQPLTETGPDVFLTESRSSSEGTPIRNRILLALPDNEFQILRPLLSLQELPRYASLHEPGAPLELVYFPNSGLVSMVIVTREGKMVEVGVVGNEGVVGAPAFVGLSRIPQRAVVQIAGEGFRIRVPTLQGALPSTPLLLQIANQHAVMQGMQAAQSAACNRLHGVEQRLARWLLLMYDRVDEDSLHITHDFLATMLGTDRPSVSLAAGALQKKGAIEYTRGAVRLSNRERLEEAACECYEVMQKLYSPLRSAPRIEEPIQRKAG